MDVDNIRAVAREVFLEEMGKLQGYAFIRDARAGISDAALPKMTQRHIEVADLLILGLCNKEIAHRLGVAEGTVKQHVHKLMRLLGANNRTHAALMWHARSVQAARMAEAVS